MSINLSEARMTTLVVHQVGNKVKNQGVGQSEFIQPLDNDAKVDTLKEFFLSPFKKDEFYRFNNPDTNPVYKAVRSLFNDSFDNFLPQTINLLNHLYDQGKHPQVKSGWFYVAHFRECQLDGQTLHAIGIFKTESKDYFIQNVEFADGLRVVTADGYNLRTLDKGCLIFDTFSEDGYTIALVNKDEHDTSYWQDDFIGCQRIHDPNRLTSFFIDMMAEFVNDPSYGLDALQRTHLLNQTMEYLNLRESFDLGEFKNEVMPHPNRHDFDDFIEASKEPYGFDPAEGFLISKQAVKSQKLRHKPVIKLDSGVAIHFDRKKFEQAFAEIERCVDKQRGMYYYKVYFREEL